MVAPAGRSRTTWFLASVGSFVLGLITIGSFLHAPPADAYWTDTATITSGTFTTWGLSDVQCPSPSWPSSGLDLSGGADDHRLTWDVPSGTSTVTLALDPLSPTPGGLGALSFSWSPTSTVRSDAQLTTSGTEALWGTSTSNVAPLAIFAGTWILEAEAPGGVWSATRTGSWDISWATRLAGCSVDP